MVPRHDVTSFRIMFQARKARQDEVVSSPSNWMAPLLLVCNPQPSDGSWTFLHSYGKNVPQLQLLGCNCLYWYVSLQETVI